MNYNIIFGEGQCDEFLGQQQRLNRKRNLICRYYFKVLCIQVWHLNRYSKTFHNASTDGAQLLINVPTF